ncbi:hypothetical protein GCM10027189_02630 [Rufibacter soli]
MTRQLLSSIKANARRYGILLSLMILATVGAFALGDAYVDAGLPAPTVTSDKDDYVPGEIATISGKGWTLDKYVDVHLEEDPAYIHSHDYHDVKVEENGTWQITYPIEERHLGVKFTVNAEGKTTGSNATTTFTDGDVRVTSISPTPFSGYVGNTVIKVTNYTNGKQSNHKIQIIKGSGSSTELIWESTEFDINNNSTIDAAVWNGTYNLPIGSPRVGTKVPTGSYTARVVDALGNTTSPSSVSPTVGPTKNVDVNHDRPSVTINQALNQADPTTLSPVNFTVVFNESVIGFTSSDITLSAPAGATASVTGSGKNYNVAVSGMTTDGTVTASINANVAQNTIGNGNTASTSIDNSITYNTCTAIASLSYTTPNQYCVGTAITNNAPTTTGGMVTTYSISPALPDGLSLNTNTGIISGTPTTAVVAANYTITATNACSSPTAVISIAVGAAPVVTTQPVSTPSTFTYGSDATFSVEAFGTGTLGYQWQVNDGNGFVNIEGATSASLAINRPTVSMNGYTYHCVITNDCGTATSSAAKLTVKALALTGSFTADNKDYDGTNNATVTSYSVTTKFGSDDVNLIGGSATFSDENAGIGKTVTLTGATLSGSQAENYSLTFVNTSTANINPTNATASVVVASSYTYTGEAQGATAASVNGLEGVSLAKTVTYEGVSPTNYTSSSTAPTAAGNYRVTVALASTETNYKAVSETKAFTIDKATPTVAAIGGDFKYDGTPKVGSGSVKGVHIPAESLMPAVTLNYVGTPNGGASTSYNSEVAPTEAGVYTVTARFAGNDNYISKASIAASLTISKATPVISLTVGGPFTFTNTAKEVESAIVKGIDNASLGNATVEYKQSGDVVTPIDAGDYDVIASYEGSNNYLPIKASKFGTLTIGQATPTVTLTLAPSYTFTGSPQGATVATVTGVSGVALGKNILYEGISPTEYSASSVPPTNAGTYRTTFSFDGSNNNYKAASDSKTFTIDRANQTITFAEITDKTFGEPAFNINPSASSELPVSITTTGGIGYDATTGRVTITGAGSASITASQGGNGNYNEATAITHKFNVAQASNSITFTEITDKTFGDAAFSVTASAASGAEVSFTVVSGPATIDGSTLTLTGAGKVTVKATSAKTTNYIKPEDVSRTFNIAKATPIVTASVIGGIYNGSAYSGTGTATGVGSEDLSPAITFSYAQTTDHGANWTEIEGAPIGAGSYKVTASYAETTNYNPAFDSKTFTIGKASSTTSVTISGAPFTYTGSAITPATVSVTGAGGLNLAPAASYTNNINAGKATVSYTFAGDANHTGSNDSETFTIDKATPNVTASATSGTYSGSAFSGTATATGVGAPPENLSSALTFTYEQTTNGTTWTAIAEAPVNAGSYKVTASYAATTNYNLATDSKTFTIDKAASTIIIIGDNTFTYTGAAQGPAAVTSTGSAGTVSYSYSGTSNGNIAYAASGSKPTMAGTYSVIASLAGDSNHEPATSQAVSFTIARASSKTTVTIAGGPFTYTGAAIQPATVSVTGAGGLDLTPTATYANNVNAGTASASYSYEETDNYLASAGSNTFTIGKANPNITVTPYEVTYDGNVHTVIGTAKGVKGETLDGLDLSKTTHTSAGTFTTDVWSFTDVTGNYKDVVSTNITNKIDKARLTYVATAASKTYGDGNGNLTGTVTGFVSGENLGNATTGTLSFTSPATSTTGIGTVAINGSGLSATNYTFAQATANETALTITQRSLYFTSTRDYNGSATFAADLLEVGNTVNNDVVTVSGSSSVSSKNVNSYTGFATNNLTSSNNNYKVSGGTVAISITPRTLNVSATGANKVYDGTTKATVTLSDDKVKDDLVTTAYTAASFNDANIGNEKPVDVSGISVTGGLDAGNYTLGNTTASTKANITVLAVTVTPKASYSRQYSDLDPTFEYNVSPAIISSDAFTGALSRVAGEAPGAYAITLGNLALNSNYTLTFSNPTTSAKVLNITKEDARAYYTGALFASTSSTTSSTATVTLSATIKDITAVDGSNDLNGGDVRNAKVSFINKDNGTVFAANVPVGLINANDTKVGTATVNVSLGTGNADAAQYTIGMIVNNYYDRNSSEDNVIITIAKPVSGMITGGGYNILKNSGGLKAGDIGSNNNFGFNVKNDKSGPKGTINTIVRRMESDGLHVYQIKGNAMTSLVITNATSSSPASAVFNGKANIQDITNPTAPVSVDGNASLQVTMTDLGEPGKNDRIGLTLWDKNGGLWFANSYDGTRTNEQQLDGGNLKVLGGSFTTGSGATTVGLTSSKNPSAVGEQVLFTATVTGSGTSKPTGNVSFLNLTTGKTLATFAVSSTGTVTFTTNSLEKGSHDIVAYYGGDSKFGNNSAVVKQEVGTTSAPVATTTAKSIAAPDLSAKPQAKLTSYPNPFTDQTTIEFAFDKDEDYNLVIYSANGTLVKTLKSGKARANTPVQVTWGDNSHNVGVYFIKLVTTNGVQTMRVVRQ